MNILVVLRNLYGNPDPFEDELIIGDSDVNAISEACELRDTLNSGSSMDSTVTALLFSESESDSNKVLIKAASYGADEVIHFTADDFDFTDSNIFSRLIAETIKRCFGCDSSLPSPDILMFGRLAYDGDSVNIATQTATKLGFSQAIYSKRVESLSDSLTYTKSLDKGNEALMEVKLPAVLQSIRKEGLRRQAKISDIMRAYGQVQVQEIPKDISSGLIKAATSAPSLGRGKQEIPPYLAAKEMINLNGISDIETAQNIINTLKALGFEPRR